MSTRKAFYLITFFLVGVAGYSCAQTKTNKHQLIGTCEGCEAIFEYGKRPLSSVDTLPGFETAATKIKVTGIIYQPDGITPAEGIILYVYQTNAEGVYPTKGSEKDWSKRHGYIRGWIKTGKDGRYTFYTLKPGTYPSRTGAAHIHPTILEPSGKYYWVDEYLFEGDPLLTSEQLSRKAPVGGSSGVLRLRREGDLLIGERDFVLGKNVQGMKIRGLAALLLLFTACGERNDSAILETETAMMTASATSEDGNINLEKSVIYWKGTKFRNTGYHEGFLKLKEGTLTVENGIIKGT